MLLMWFLLMRGSGGISCYIPVIMIGGRRTSHSPPESQNLSEVQEVGPRYMVPTVSSLYQVGYGTISSYRCTLCGAQDSHYCYR